MKLVTHGGSFHLDDVIAAATLKLLDHTDVVRTRDEDVIAHADLRFDVGGVYDATKNSYDHHQKGGAGNRDNGVPYASAGLIWKHFGSNLVDSDEAHALVDSRLMQFVDAIDTGTKAHGPETYSLHELIRGYNVRADLGSCSSDEAFDRAVCVGADAVENELLFAKKQVADNEVVRGCLSEYVNEPYVVVPKDVLWQPVLVTETDKQYVLFDDDGSYRVRAIPAEVDGFELRQRLPESWGGLSGSELESKSGVVGAVFCHAGGFIGGAKDEASALAFVKKAYMENNKN
jgi:uncharacterized UPF0160 family protein